LVAQFRDRGHERLAEPLVEELQLLGLSGIHVVRVVNVGGKIGKSSVYLEESNRGDRVYVGVCNN
jgi:hypothetical protein